MPKIPIQQKQVRTAGSTGVKADIDINSPQFAAVARLGASVEGLADQKFDAGIRQQRHVDKGAVASYAADNSVFKNQLDLDLTESANNPKRQNEITQGAFRDRRAALTNQLESRGVSNAQRRQLNNDLDALEKNFNTGLKKKQLVEARELANSDITRAAFELAKNDQIDEAISAISNLESPQSVIDDLSVKLTDFHNNGVQESLETASSLAGTQEENQLLIDKARDSGLPTVQKERLLQKLNSRQSSLFKAQELTSMEQYEIDASLTNTQADVDALKLAASKDSTLGATSKIRTQQMFQRRGISIASADKTNIKNQLALAQKDFSLILSGAIVSELQISDSLDPQYKESLINVLESKGGSRGVDSKEYLELVDQIGEFDGSGWIQDDVSVEGKQEVLAFMDDPENSTEAKLNIADLAFTNYNIDVSDDGELEGFLGLTEGQNGEMLLDWKDESINVDASQVMAIRKIGFQMSELIGAAKRNGSWVNSSISYSDTADIYTFMHSKDVIDAFANIDTTTPEGKEQLDNTYNAVIQPRLDRAIERNAKFQFKKLITSVNQGL
jgi:hypothetical protein